jgi:CheY-like chemotaxis protein
MTTGIEVRLIPIQNSHGRCPKVLVVDDDKDTRDLVRLHLAEAGYGVSLAEDAIAAARLLGAAPDLLIIDVQMPYLNRLDFVATLLADSIIPRVPVVFISSNERFALTAQVLGTGFLLKPFLRNDLLDAVSRTLAARPGAAVD